MTKRLKMSNADIQSYRRFPDRWGWPRSIHGPVMPRRTGCGRPYPLPVLVVAAVAVLFFPDRSWAQGDSRRHVKTSVELAATTVTAGGYLPVAVVFDHEPGWHIHTHDPTVPPELEPFIPVKTEIGVEVPADGPLTAHVEHIQWPAVEQVEVAFLGTPVEYGVYGGRAIAFLPLSIDADAMPGTASFVVTITFQACNDQTCMFPVRPPIEFERKVQIVATGGSTSFVSSGRASDLFAGFSPDVWEKISSGGAGVTAGPIRTDPVRFNLFGWQFEVGLDNTVSHVLLLILAAFGGLLLNFTPCVLPVIPIKIMSLSQAADHRGRCFTLGLSMSFGVALFWVGLGAAVTAFTNVTATNQLFKYPVFTILIGLFIAVMAVGMCGFFSLRLPSWVYQVSPRHDSVLGSFVFGIMAAVLSTPCTAPFMGSAAAWAVQQSVLATLVTFAAIGSGMALPYLLLSAFPQWVAKLPRSGPGSELLKQVMGLLMMAAAVYFLGIGFTSLFSTPPDPPSLGYWWFVFGFIGGAGGWLAYRSLRISQMVAKQAVVVALGVLMLVGSWVWALRLTNRGPIDWQYYTPDRFQAALDAGNVVVMDFTAEWCLNCKALEHEVLFADSVVRAVRQERVVAMKVDLTGGYSAGFAQLKEVGRVMIPLLVVFNPDGTEQFKSDFYTQGQVVRAIDSALQ